MRPAEWKGRREESEVRAAGETRGVVLELRQRRGRRAGQSEAWGSGVGQHSTREAHLEHPEHARDAGRVEAQRLVERIRHLPSKRRKHRKKGRHAGRGAGGRGEAAAVQAACRKPPTVGAEGRAGAERTSNMDSMFVTLDV